MSTGERKRRLAQAEELARDRANLWRVFYRRVKTTGVRLVEATSEGRAMSLVRGGYQARPVLPSSAWRAIYKEVGL